LFVEDRPSRRRGALWRGLGGAVCGLGGTGTPFPLYAWWSACVRGQRACACGASADAVLSQLSLVCCRPRVGGRAIPIWAARERTCPVRWRSRWAGLRERHDRWDGEAPFETGRETPGGQSDPAVLCSGVRACVCSGYAGRAQRGQRGRARRGGWGRRGGSQCMRRLRRMMQRGGGCTRGGPTATHRVEDSSLWLSAAWRLDGRGLLSPFPGRDPVFGASGPLSCDTCVRAVETSFQCELRLSETLSCARPCCWVPVGRVLVSQGCTQSLDPQVKAWHISETTAGSPHSPQPRGAPGAAAGGPCTNPHGAAG